MSSDLEINLKAEDQDWTERGWRRWDPTSSSNDDVGWVLQLCRALSWRRQSFWVGFGFVGLSFINVSQYTFVVAPRGRNLTKKDAFPVQDFLNWWSLVEYLWFCLRFGMTSFFGLPFWRNCVIGNPWSRLKYHYFDQVYKKCYSSIHIMLLISKI